jgi:uncharacterized protein YggE
MKKLYTLLFMSLCLVAFSQEQSPPFIDVTGTAEMEVIPDEIYIAITLRERSGNRGTQTVQEQESDLKDALRSLGLDLKRLELSDANADYIYIRWLNKKTISQSRYRFKAEDAYMVGKVFEQLDKLNIQDAYISEVSHSKIKDYEKEVQINAIKDAKDRADYLLTAIDEKRGKAMEVYENKRHKRLETILLIALVLLSMVVFYFLIYLTLFFHKLSTTPAITIAIPIRLISP